MVSGVFLFSNACRRCIPRGWALFLQPVFHSGHIGNAVPGGVPFFHALLFLEYLFRKAGWDLAKRGHRTLSSSRSCLSLFAVCFSEIRGETIGLSAKSPAAAGWISAIGPIAFAYDGWVIATAISHEVKDARRNMPRALLVCTCVCHRHIYPLFSRRIKLLGPEAVRTMGDRHVAFLAGRLLGPFGAKVMLLFILIAVAGTLNGVILGYLRLPHALAKRGLLPLSRIFAEPRAFLRALPAYTASCVWAALNYLSERYAWLPNADVSEIPIVMGYLLYAVLYVQVIRLWNQGENHWFLARRGDSLRCSGRRGVL